MYDDSPFDKERHNIKIWFTVFVIVFAILAFYGQKLYWTSVSYTGTVVEKHVEYGGSRRHHTRTYILVVKTQKGKVYHQPVSFDIYSSARVGAWVVKRKGKLYPTIVSGP